MITFGRGVALTLMATALVAAAVILTTASMVELNHSGTMLGSMATLGSMQKLLYITAEPSSDLVSLPNTIYTVQLTQNNINNMYNIILKFSKNNDIYIIIDLRNIKENQINSIKMILKKVIAEMGRPVVLIGSPESIETIVKDLVTAYGIPTFIAKSKDLSKIKYIKINTLIYALIPEKVAGHTIIVSNVVVNNSAIADNLNDVLNRVSKYTATRRKETIRLAFTLPSQTAELMTQLDASATFEPWGRINARDALYKVLDDGNPNYVWFVYRFIDQIIPGELIWGNGWRNNILAQLIDADYNDPTGFLSYYSPSTYVSAETKTKSVELSISGGKDKDGVSVGGSLTIGYSWSYTKPDIEIIDQSDYSLELAKWENRINKGKAVGTSTVQLEPGAIIRYPEGGTHHFRTMYIGQWARKRLLFWSYSDYAILIVDWTIRSS